MTISDETLNEMEEWYKIASDSERLAHADTDLPLLIKELRQAQRELDAARKVVEAHREALQKVMAHTGHLPGASRDLLSGLLVSVARIASASLIDGPKLPSPAALAASPAVGEESKPVATEGFWKGKRYTIAVDFDGVLHRYDTPFIDHATTPDPPVEGALEWLAEIVKKFDVAIFTTRANTSEGIEAVQAWLHKHGFDYGLVNITAMKPPALVYIDDRAWRFDGKHFPTASEIHAAKPWHKAPPVPVEVGRGEAERHKCPATDAAIKAIEDAERFLNQANGGDGEVSRRIVDLNNQVADSHADIWDRITDLRNALKDAESALTSTPAAEVPK